MPDYSTGELARLCGVTVRTVQFYDARGLLHPADLSEGGRRLYSESDLRKMRMICALKTLGLSLDAIQGVLASEKPERVLLLLLEEQERRIADEHRLPFDVKAFNATTNYNESTNLIDSF